MIETALDIAPEVGVAAARGLAVALETTVLAHGLPYPQNLSTVREMEAIVRAAGAVPAGIALLRGRVRVGLSGAELQELATAPDVDKVSRRDIAACLVAGRLGATTVAATMLLAHLAGIRVFATGGIGGVHRVHVASAARARGQGSLPTPASPAQDISADLPELARTPVCVVCSGAKSILDLPATVEWLETWGVPVIGFQTGEFPAFIVRSSGLPVSARAGSAAEVARMCRVHWALEGGGVLLAVPVPERDAMPADEFERSLLQALDEAATQDVSGSALTPFLLKRIAELTGGRSMSANIALLRNNAAVAASVALALSAQET